MTTPCVGKSDLFDSTDARDHAEAKALCEQCPALASCFAELTATRHTGAYADPQGTWAGQLLVPNRRRGSHRAEFKAWRAAS